MRPSSARGGSLEKTGWGMTRSRSRSTPSRASVSRAALAVHDDSVEAAEQAPPEPLAAGRAPRQQVVGGEHGRAARPEEPVVDLRSGQPLDVQHVARDRGEPRHPERMLEHLQRQPQPRAPEEPRGERVEDLGRT